MTIDNHYSTNAILALDGWLDTMRGPDGYMGPVSHWWQNCLQFTGAGLDWRYEGIIAGYLNLFKATGDERWLRKARRAGDDLLAGQLENGNFRNSSFELNPYTGGTPHEAACAIGLLQLALALRKHEDTDWKTYAAAAERNLRQYYIGALWDSETRWFRDNPNVRSFVPNKSATLSEALFLLTQATDDATFAEQYALPTLDAVIKHQVHGGSLDGAIYQNSFGTRKVAKFFPYYVARCVPGLVDGFAWSRDERYLDAARRAMDFVVRYRYSNGSFPQVVYPNNKVNRYPQWVAGVGDILRAMAVLRPYGVVANPEPTLSWMLRGQEQSGGIRTAYGFDVQISQRTPGIVPDFRDLLTVCGWADKAFRYLTQELSSNIQLPIRDDNANYDISASNLTCVCRDLRANFREDANVVELKHRGETLYRWEKGHPWAEVSTREVLWK